MKTENYVEKIKYLFRTSVVVAAVFGLCFVSYDITRAASLSDLQKKQEEINKSIADKANQVSQKKEEIKLVADEISKVDAEIAEIEAKIQNTTNQIGQTQSDINDKQSQIDLKMKDLEREQENQKESIRAMYEGGYSDTFEIIMGSNTLSDIINHSSYLESIENKIEITIEDINRIKADLEKQKKELEDKKNELSQLQDQQSAFKYGLDQSKNQKSRILSDAKSQKNDLESQIAESKKLNSQVESQINSILAASKGDNRSVAARDRGTSTVGFQWPMDYKYISTYYGESTPFQSFHSGIDLVNVMGSPVYAAGDGTVSVVADMMTDGHYYGYGKYIVIGHNARFSSLYGHLIGFTVSVGQEVHKGDVIGYEGSTGWSTGAHLHFEIWDNGARVNPMNYLP